MLQCCSVPVAFGPAAIALAALCRLRQAERRSALYTRPGGGGWRSPFPTAWQAAAHAAAAAYPSFKTGIPCPAATALLGAGSEGCGFFALAQSLAAEFGTLRDVPGAAWCSRCALPAAGAGWLQPCTKHASGEGAGKEKHACAHAAGRFMVAAERWEESAPASAHVNPAVAGELLVSHRLLLPLSPLPASSSSTHERVLGAFKKMRKAALAGNTHTFTKVRRIRVGFELRFVPPAQHACAGSAAGMCGRPVLGRHIALQWLRIMQAEMFPSRRRLHHRPCVLMARQRAMPNQ